MRSTYLRGLVGMLAVAGAALVSGCGASSTVSQALDPVAKAADVTSTVQGYRISADMTVGSATSKVQATISGTMDRADHTGQMTAHESVAGRQLTVAERFSGLTFYMDADGIPGLSQVTHGKRWLKMDMSRTIGSLGLGSLSTTSSDPSQFVDYLRAVSADTKKIGTDVVRGVTATHYHAVVDLDRYPNLVSGTQRSSAKQAVSTLESALGSHTLAMDVWIDGHKLVRRLQFGYPECVNNQKLNLSMSMDLYDYGAQPSTQIPSDADAYDLTPLITSAMKNIKFGCGSSSSG